MKPQVEKIFDDLDALLDFCRIELLPYNPADLYNRQSKVWQSYEASKRPRREWKPRGHTNYRTNR